MSYGRVHRRESTPPGRDGMIREQTFGSGRCLVEMARLFHLQPLCWVWAGASGTTVESALDFHPP